MKVYCLKCKSKKECTDMNLVSKKNPRTNTHVYMCKGFCKKCGTKCCTFLNKEMYTNMINK